jgi:lipase maturation factor 1
MRHTRRLFLGLLGLTAVVAVGSFWLQVPGLSGARGIAPAAGYLAAARRVPGLSFADLPTLLWLADGDWMLHGLCAVGVASGVLLMLHLAPRAALVALWASWLSLTQVCHPWLDFQWDLLLLEAAALAFFFAPPGWRPRPPAEPEPSPAMRALLALLACKVTLESGLVKLLSGDPAWRDLTALTYHWWTQPLPPWTAAVMAELPGWAQRALCGGVFLLELPLPLLALGPRPARLVAAGGLIGLQVALGLTGNFAFYGLLTATLAVPLLDDRALAWLTRGRLPELPPAPAAAVSGWPGWTLVAVVALLSALRFAPRTGLPLPAWAEREAPWLQPFESVNAYGAFATMTRTRDEVQLEATLDGAAWEPYVLPFKPGPRDRRPRFVAPLQPRLDWQLWFAGLQPCGGSPWLLDLQGRLLQGVPEVRALFEAEPFGGRRPLAVRTRGFTYRFAPWSAQGAWWTATELGPWCPPLTLGGAGELRRFEPP